MGPAVEGQTVVRLCLPWQWDWV